MVENEYNMDENDLEDFQDFEDFYGLGDDEDEEPKELDFDNLCGSGEISLDLNIDELEL